jgi:hypothetical protein
MKMAYIIDSFQRYGDRVHNGQQDIPSGAIYWIARESCAEYIKNSKTSNQTQNKNNLQKLLLPWHMIRSSGRHRLCVCGCSRTQLIPFEDSKFGSGYKGKFL